MCVYVHVHHASFVDVGGQQPLIYLDQCYQVSEKDVRKIGYVVV